jgi:hypothetical protein
MTTTWSLDRDKPVNGQIREPETYRGTLAAVRIAVAGSLELPEPAPPG